MTNPCFDRATPLRIGVFDSGVGGLSVLRAIRHRLPGADLLYVADTGHAPYGDRGEDYVCDRSRRIAEFLHDRGARVLVVACNTATAAAVAALRQDWPDLPIVGVEPGIKPAVALSKTRRVGVLATTGTLASAKFRRLAEEHAAGATLVLQPCPGLADAIEAIDPDAGQQAGLAALVEQYGRPLREAEVDVAVLGCTHYIFARAHFERALPGVALLDTAEAVARQTARLAGLATSGAVPARAPRLRAWSSGDPRVLSGFATQWLAGTPTVEPLTV